MIWLDSYFSSIRNSFVPKDETELMKKCYLNLGRRQNMLLGEISLSSLFF